MHLRHPLLDLRLIVVKSEQLAQFMATTPLDTKGWGLLHQVLGIGFGFGFRIGLGLGAPPPGFKSFSHWAKIAIE